jgi:3-methyladenine DNA glycosylase/8-oxoguanine DNA glycosylase
VSTVKRGRVRVPFLPPLDLPALLRFLAARAIPGVEQVHGLSYRRTVRLPGASRPSGAARERRAAGEDGAALLTISPGAESFLDCACAPLPRGARAFVLERATALTRADRDPARAAHLARDPLLAPVLARHPGLRVPGAWDPFEVAVRAVLGQQVSVAGAATLARRLVEAFGEPLPARLCAHAAAFEPPQDERQATPLTRLFPTPRALAEATAEEIRRIGMPGSRARALHGLACAAADSKLDFAKLSTAPLDEAVLALDALPGIGPWTAHYLALRAHPSTDAFPEGDLVLLKALRRKHPRATFQTLLERAARWQPDRALASIALWVSEGERG